MGEDIRDDAFKKGAAPMNITTVGPDNARQVFTHGKGPDLQIRVCPAIEIAANNTHALIVVRQTSCHPYQP
jgi:hypothetical protein